MMARSDQAAGLATLAETTNRSLPAQDLPEANPRTMVMDFFTRLDDLVSCCEVAVDRPRGCLHPRYPAAIYPLDYGHLTGTHSGDGHEVDLFRGSAEGTGVVGVFLTVDLLKRDLEVKLLLDRTPQEVDLVGRFLEESLHLSPRLVPRAVWQGRGGAG